jgi:hypothetical protein
MTLNPNASEEERVWFNGKAMPIELWRTYCALDERIKSFERNGRPAPEHILNGRHNLAASFIHASNNPNWSK